jgi:nucleoside-triphosphatase THEP1
MLVLSGESGCGKTTLCAQVISLARAQGRVVAGLLTLPRLVDGRKVGLQVENVSTGERHPLAEAYSEPGVSPMGPISGLTTESWRFLAEGLAWGTSVLRHATPCDLLVIDELGPLELVRDQGWKIGLDVLRAGGYRLAVVVVRPALLPCLRERLDQVEPPILAVTRDNRDALLGQIATLLGDDI